MTPPILTILPIHGLDLAVWEWPGDGPPLLFAHATGFHARCWDQIVERLPGRRAIAVDLRGHGRSSKPQPPYHWQAFGDDLAAVAEALQIRDAVGVGHSMGGHTVVAAAAQRPETFASILLIDPTIFRPEIYRIPNAEVAFIRRRRNVWQSPKAMFESFRPRLPFAQWDPNVLRDYCEFGLLPDGAGAFVLACPPEMEASIYEHSHEPAADLYPVIPAIRQPVTVMRAGTEWQTEKFDLSSSPTAPDLASKFPQGRDILLTGRSHYIPMESPDLVASELWGSDSSLPPALSLREP